MKRFYFLLMVVLCGCVTLHAQDQLSLECSIQKNGKGVIVVKQSFDSNPSFTAYSFDVVLPDDFTLDTDKKGKYLLQLGSCHQPSHNAIVNHVEKEKVYAVACISMESEPLDNTQSVLMTIPVVSSRPITVGENFRIELVNVRASDTLGTSYKLNNVEQVFPIGTDGIDNYINYNPSAPSGVYGINGAKISDGNSISNNTQKGVYIVNGKKMVK